MNKYFPLIMWIFAAIVVFVSAYMLFSFSGETENLSETILSSDSSVVNREIAAEVGRYTLYTSDLVLVRAGENAVESWTYDQLLACAAEDAGFENTAISRFVQERAKQIYLRDLMLQTIYESISAPTDEEILQYMNNNPELFFVERHYYQIIAADSLIADSLHTRLSLGRNFQVTAQNISLGQKAAIGGDLGFVTGGEMLAQGLPESIAYLDGLSDVVQSSIGWHIFKVSESQAISDTMRVARSVAEILYNERVEAKIDSVLSSTQNRLNLATDTEETI